MLLLAAPSFPTVLIHQFSIRSLFFHVKVPTAGRAATGSESKPIQVYHCGVGKTDGIALCVRAEDSLMSLFREIRAQVSM